jgi:UrcA family protein
MIRLAIAGALVALIATPALAEDGAWQIGNNQIHVIDSQLDTNTAAGRAKLLTHVERAAMRLCRDLRGGDRRACIAETVELTQRRPGGAALVLALRERNGVMLAAR